MVSFGHLLYKLFETTLLDATYLADILTPVPTSDVPHLHGYNFPGPYYDIIKMLFLIAFNSIQTMNDLPQQPPGCFSVPLASQAENKILGF